MAQYGEVAVLAVRLVRRGDVPSPVDAWHAAARDRIQSSEGSRRKSCPRDAFLGLCEAGLVAGVPAGQYTRSRKNKTYALEVVRLLIRDAERRSAGPRELWDDVMDGARNRPKGQMDVVLALWTAGLIVRPTAA